MRNYKTVNCYGILANHQMVKIANTCGSGGLDWTGSTKKDILKHFGESYDTFDRPEKKELHGSTIYPVQFHKLCYVAAKMLADRRDETNRMFDKLVQEEK